MKVLVSAYACSPDWGSEPGVGWGFVTELAKHHDLWVIVEEVFFRENIERYLKENPGSFDRVNFFFISATRKPFLRKLWPPSFYYFYKNWHKKAYDLARKLHKEVDFDLAHQLTMVGFREPGYLWQLGIPFVWGPVGGMGFFPWRFVPTLGLYGALYYSAYNLFNYWQMRFSLRPRRAAKLAGSGLIAATPDNVVGAARYWGNRQATMMSEVGVPPVQAVEPTLRSATQPLTLVWSGQHKPGKALNLGLEALARLPASSNWQLQVLGKGERSAQWQRLAQRLRIADRVKFHGWLPREEAMRIMQQSHLMLITSLRDLTSTVTIEALAQGLPIVCLDHCGFAGVVDDSCGIKVAVTSPTRTIAGISEAIVRIENDEVLRRRLSRGAMQRSQDFAWENKIAVLNGIYQQVVATHGCAAS